jgi:hypothetical protein
MRTLTLTTTLAGFARLTGYVHQTDVAQTAVRKREFVVASQSARAAGGTRATRAPLGRANVLGHRDRRVTLNAAHAFRCSRTHAGLDALAARPRSASHRLYECPVRITITRDDALLPVSLSHGT